MYAGARVPIAVRVTDGGNRLTLVPATPSPGEERSTSLKKTTRTQLPGAAFELYLSVESQAEAASMQRIAPPAERAAALVVDAKTRERTWTIEEPGTDRVVVRLRLGDDVTTGEANRLLATVRRTIWQSA